MSIDSAHAGVEVSAALNVTADGPLAVTLTDCAKARVRTLHFG